MRYSRGAPTNLTSLQPSVALSRLMFVGIFVISLLQEVPTWHRFQTTPS